MNMVYKVVPSPKFEKDLKKIGKSNATEIIKWIEKNLENTQNPREKGKQLKYDFQEYWRYRIGDFRLLVEIIDNKLILSLITVAHRREIYG
ncbi:MAG: type II toxin-antitoxin system RelE/ParE family toxin [Chitinivibrionia bacterium]|nr:type II toxin-antitoxin system RelE/ParE family toxin [Chitinivibrionia bacterium]